MSPDAGPRDVFQVSPHLTILPALYGSAGFALEVRRRLRGMDFDCVAVPLPPSMRIPVVEGVGQLPRVSAVLQIEQSVGIAVSGDDAEDRGACNFVPIDPCQAVIAAIREGLERGTDVQFVDLEVSSFDGDSPSVKLVDPYALKDMSYERLLAALVPTLAAPEEGSQRLQRIRRMAFELHRLELDSRHVVFVCAIEDWPWVRQAYQLRSPYAKHEPVAMPHLSNVGEEDLYFVLGELPYITYLYEHRRAELMEDALLAIDGVKTLMLGARESWRRNPDFDRGWLTAHRLGLMLTYLRNRCLMDGRLTPDLYNLAIAGREVVGDDYALALIDMARMYPPQKIPQPDTPSALVTGDGIRFGVDALITGEGDLLTAKNRLRGVLREWRTLPLKPSTPPPRQRREWNTFNWDPSGQCSYPPEDRRIESFQQHVREQARQLLGEEGVRVEPFRASLLDGLDIRETLRNWYTGTLYVKEMPASRGAVEVVVFLFESSPFASEERYPWKGTWYAEHQKESTLSFFATDYKKTMIGPGIGQAIYGGCSFIFPPRPIVDIWHDYHFDHARSCDERLLLGALAHSRERKIVLVAPQPPSSRWRLLARQQGHQIVYLPLGRFSSAVVERLRHFHVLGGKQVRSYASRFIQDMR